MSEEVGEIPGSENFKSPKTLTRKGNLKEMFGTLRKGYKELESNLTEAKNIPVPDEVLEAYEGHKDSILNLYGIEHVNPNLLYHGTGAIQYDGDKYRGGTSTEYTRPLDSILQEGLKPHHDMWIQGGSGGVDSTSFATAWPYAKWYSDKHQDPNDPLAWEYGDSTEWFQYNMLDTVKRGAQNALLHPSASLRRYGPAIANRIGDALRNTMRDAPSDSRELDKLQQWISDVRSDVTPSTPGIEVLHGSTDIPDNFGAIITINRSDVELFDMGSGGVYEERTQSEVVPNRFRSLSVPLNKVGEYEQKIKQLGLSVPVLPIEAVDYHFSHFPFQELTKSLRAK